NDSTSIVEPSASTTDVIIAQNEIEDNTITKARRTGHSSQRWADKDEKILLKALEEGKTLSEIKLLIHNRTDNALIRRALKFDFGSNKKDNDICFSPNIKRRNRTAKVDITHECIDTQEINEVLDTVPEVRTVEQFIDTTDLQSILHKIIDMSISDKEIIYNVIDATRRVPA
ncbi:MAG: hypothetical protein U9O86_04065, partial [Campylobacterota bacterium]|nr:hypothetical protein [Campylobacterota bacterium]